MLGNEELLMLNIGTKVFIKHLYKEDRPETQQQRRQGLRYIICEYGYIVDCADNGYYLVAHEDDMIHHEDDVEEYGVYIHEDEMVNMDTYKPKFKIGDKVRICEPTEHDRKHYLVGWMYDMRECIGQVVTIESCLSRPNCYRVKENKWAWEGTNLEPLCEFVGY